MGKDDVKTPEKKTPPAAPAPSQEQPPAAVPETDSPGTAVARTGLEARKETSSEKTKTALGDLSKTVESSLNDFVTAVMESGTDFKGSDWNLSREELMKNTYFETMYKELSNFLVIGANEKIPPEFFSVWAEAATKFVAHEIASFEGILNVSRMNNDDVKTTLAALKDGSKKGPSGALGIGPFSEWIKKDAPDPTKEDYKKWEQEQVETNRVQQELGSKKQFAKQALSTTISSETYAAVFLFAGIQSRLNDLNARIDNSTTAEQIDNLATERDKIAVFVMAVNEEFKVLKPIVSKANGLMEDPSVTDVKNEALALERELQSVDDPSKLDSLKPKIKTLGEKVTAAENYQMSALGEGEERPMLDKLYETINGMEEGKMKSFLGTLAAAATTFCVACAKLPWIGSMVRGTFISNRLLFEKAQEKGDKELEALAAKSIKVETVMRRFGLPGNLADVYGGKKVKDFLKALEKPGDVISDTTKYGKLAALKKALETKRAGISEETVLDFMQSWGSEVEYKETPSAQPAVPPPPAVAPAPTAAPATSPAPPTAAPGTQPPTPPPAPAPAPPAPPIPPVPAQ